jgi:pimeloyl-ACP methyl ester carboxylesterase
MDLFVERTGTPGGRPFLWGHGLTSSIAAERDTGVFRWEEAGGLDVVRYDARSHGRSPVGTTAEEHEWSALAGDFLAVADSTFGPGSSFAAGGASMGCATALFAALAAPSRIEALVLVIPPTAWETRAQQADTYLGSAGFLEAKGMEAFIAASRQLPAQPAWTAANREVRYRHLAATSAEGLALALRGAARSNLPSREEVASISVPALILAWEDDPGHPMSTATALQSLLAGARLEKASSAADVAAWPSVVAGFLGGS